MNASTSAIVSKPSIVDSYISTVVEQHECEALVDSTGRRVTPVSPGRRGSPFGERVETGT
jgi:hypothetical protein